MEDSTPDTVPPDNRAPLVPGPDVWPGMSRADFDTLGRYIRESADKLELRDWWFVVISEPSDEDCNATVYVTLHRKRATIRVNREWVKGRTEEEKRQTIAHELIPCHLNALQHFVETAILDELSSSARNPAYAAVNAMMELAVDGLAAGACKALDTYPGHRRGPYIGDEHECEIRREPKCS